MKERELPEGWEYSTLLDAVGGKPSSVVGGPFGSCLKVEHYLDKGIPIIRLQNIGRRKFIKKDIKYVSQEKAEELSYHSYQKGDLVLAKLGDPIGKTCIIPDDEENGIVVSDAVRIRNANLSVFSKYLMYVLNSESISRQLNKQVFGTTRPRVNLEEVRQLKIPLPPLPVQRQIVAVLEQAEAVKRQRQDADALTGSLLQSVFYEMFGDPVRNEKGWKIDTIENNVTRLTNGFVGPTRDIYVDEGIPYLMAKHIKNKKISFDYTTFVTEKFNQKHAKSILEKGDVLLVQSGDIGQTAVVQDNHVGHNCHALIVITPRKDTLDGQYLSYIFSSTAGKAFIGSIETGITLSHLNCKDVKRLKIPLPTLALQQQFARVVQDVERIRERQVESKREIDMLFDGLVAGAFGGELVK